MATKTRKGAIISPIITLPIFFRIGGKKGEGQLTFVL
jgi:hypothetical protein